MVEFYYWREGSGGRSRLECVVLFLPDVWSAQPSRIEWTTVQDQYKAAGDAALRRLDGEDSEPAPPAPAPSAEDSSDKSQIVCSQFCFVLFPAAALLPYLEDVALADRQEFDAEHWRSYILVAEHVALLLINPLKKFTTKVY